MVEDRARDDDETSTCGESGNAESEAHKVDFAECSFDNSGDSSVSGSVVVLRIKTVEF